MIDLKNSRDESLAQATLFAIGEACKNGNNLMPPIIEAAKAYVTLGEIVIAMKTEFGEWQESAVF